MDFLSTRKSNTPLLVVIISKKNVLNYLQEKLGFFSLDVID